jgi:hypothetical protein
MPTETDDNSKSLLLAGLGRQCMYFWTISRSVIYQIPAGGTKKYLSFGLQDTCEKINVYNYLQLESTCANEQSYVVSIELNSIK